MPQINTNQSYALDKPQGRLNPITHYINQPSKKNRPRDIAQAYSLHMEHVTLQQKRHQSDGTATKKAEPSMPWRSNLDILRTKPKPNELELLKQVGPNNNNGGKQHHKRKSKVALMNRSDGNLTERSKISSYNLHELGHQPLTSRKGKQAIKIPTSRNEQLNKLRNSSDFNSSDVIESLGVIMDPGISTEERYEKYMKELELDGEIENAENQTFYRPTRAEKEFKSMLAKEGGYITTDDEDFYDDIKMKSGYFSKDEGTSRGPSKAPSRIGRVSSLGLDGRMSVTGAHFSEKKDSLSRLSMNSNTDRDGRGYVYKDGEIQRKMFLSSSRQEGTSSRGVEHDVKLMEFLTKNTKVIPVYEDSKKIKNKNKSKTFTNGSKKTKSKDDGSSKEESEVKGGGWKMSHGTKSKRQPDFDKMIPVSVVNKHDNGCEIQTQTDSPDKK